MWLSTISKRTPQAYFFFVLSCIFLVLIPAIPGIAEHFRAGPVGLASLELLLRPAILVGLALLSNRIFVSADVFKRNTLWPGHFFLLLLMASTSAMDWQDLIIHGLAALLIVNEIMNVQYNRDARQPVFYVAFTTGIAALFDFSVVFAIPFILVGLRDLKPLNLKEYTIFLLGLITPYYFVWGYAFLTGNPDYWATLFPVTEWFGYAAATEIMQLVRWAISFAAAGIALFFVFMKFNTMPVRTRRISTAVMYLIAGSLLMAIAGGVHAPAGCYLTPGFAFLATLLMLRITKAPRIEWMHIIFVVVVIVALMVRSGQLLFR